jgi:hypothetical protein
MGWLYRQTIKRWGNDDSMSFEYNVGSWQIGWECLNYPMIFTILWNNERFVMPRKDEWDY